MEEHFIFEKQDGNTIKMPVLKVLVDLEGLDEQELNMLKALVEATQEFVPISARQRHPDSLKKYEEGLELEKQHPELKHVIDLFSTAGVIEDHFGERPQHAELLNMQEMGKSEGLYPKNITKEEAEKLEQKKHSLVIEENEHYKVVANSEYFKEQLERADEKLKVAEELAEGHFKEHIKATRAELFDESEENQDNKLRTWIANDTKFDIIFDTSREEGGDDILGVRGQAGAAVFRINDKYAKLTKTLQELMQELDEQAPWTYKAKNMETPTVRFVDVVAWAGDFTHPPICVLAQNLPNEQERKDNIGCISIMYSNITELTSEQTLPLIVKEFFTEKDFANFGYISNLMTAVHELGHATSRLNFTENPASVFGSEDYTVLEEARAETFALWALNYLRKKGIVDELEEKTGYYDMVKSFLGALIHPPKAHSGSRNLMFHYFLESRALLEEEGKFRVDIEKMRESSGELLKRIADVRSEADVDGFAELKKYIKTDRKKEFEKRFENIPRGRVIVCPTIVEKDGEFSVEYPERFRDQQNSLQGWLMRNAL